MTIVNTDERVTIRDSQRWILESRLLSPGTELHIGHAGVPRGPHARLPIVYALDGNGTFGLALGAARLMCLLGELPPLMVVGVSYSDEAFRSWGARRVFELTPTRDEVWEQEAWKRGEYKDRPNTGGGPRLLECLRTEIVPVVEREFPADPQARVLLGFSFGGLFTLYAMFDQPDAFSGYVAGSPSLWWDERRMFSLEQRYADNHEDLPARLFLSIGGLESTPRPDASEARLEGIRQGRMVANLREFAATLSNRPYASLHLRAHVFDDETHVSVMPATISRGLREVLGSGSAS